MTLEWTELIGMLPEARIVQALDDDADGAADAPAWASVLAAANDRLRDALGGEPAQAHLLAAAYALKVFAAELLYHRRGFSEDRNPWSAIARDCVKRLRALATGEDIIRDGDDDGGMLVATDSRVHDAQNRIIS